MSKKRVVPDALTYSKLDAFRKAGIGETLGLRAVREGWGPQITYIGGRSFVTHQNLLAWLDELSKPSDRDVRQQRIFQERAKKAIETRWANHRARQSAA